MSEPIEDPLSTPETINQQESQESVASPGPLTSVPLDPLTDPTVQKVPKHRKQGNKLKKLKKAKSRSAGNIKSVKIQTNEPIHPKKPSKPRKFKISDVPEDTQAQPINNPQEISSPMMSSFSNQNPEIMKSDRDRPKPYQAEDIPPTEEGIRSLMRKGAWKSVLKVSESCIANETNPYHKLQFRLCRIIALIKMKMYQSAFNEFSIIGNFEEPHNHFQHHKEMYPTKKGSMIPFSMRVLLAELPHYLGKDPTMDSLYSLLNLCKSRIDHFQPKDSGSVQSVVSEAQLGNLDLESSVNGGDGIEDLDPISQDDGNESPIVRRIPRQEEIPIKDPLTSWIEPSLDEEDLTVWLEREKRVTFSIATRLIKDKEFGLALQLLEGIVERSRNDPKTLSSIGRTYLQMGNIRAARSLFERAEPLIPENSVMLLMNRGLLAFSESDYDSALKSFNEILKISPLCIQAANNRALCYLYRCELSNAIKSLEDLIYNDPSNYLHETLIFNLCTLYDLATDKSNEKKKNLINLIARYGSDNFDLSICKMQEG